MDQSDTWQYSTRVNPRVTSADVIGFADRNMDEA
jgi:hypothetical protein